MKPTFLLATICACAALFAWPTAGFAQTLSGPHSNDLSGPRSSSTGPSASSADTGDQGGQSAAAGDTNGATGGSADTGTSTTDPTTGGSTSTDSGNSGSTAGTYASGSNPGYGGNGGRTNAQRGGWGFLASLRGAHLTSQQRAQAEAIMQSARQQDRTIRETEAKQMAQLREQARQVRQAEAQQIEQLRQSVEQQLTAIMTSAQKAALAQHNESNRAHSKTAAANSNHQWPYHRHYNPGYAGRWNNGRWNNGQWQHRPVGSAPAGGTTTGGSTSTTTSGSSAPPSPPAISAS